MQKQILIIIVSFCGIMQSCAQGKNTKQVDSVVVINKKTMDTIPNNATPKGDTNKVIKTEAEWRKTLSPEVFDVARMKGTERPWTSEFENFSKIGTYYCKACGNALFKSDTKFDSGCGWPSFYEPISKNSILYHVDKTHGMVRTEVVCGKCDSHLGHVFDDGPPPTGLRYCINGVILKFDEKKEVEQKKN